VRHHLLSWIEAVDSIPHIQLIAHLCDFFHRLLELLSDPNDAIVKMSQGLLVRFLEELRSSNPEAISIKELGNIIDVLLSYATSPHPLIRETVVMWMLHLMSIGDKKLLPFTHSYIRAILPNVSSKEEAIRAAALKVDDGLTSMVRKYLVEVDETSPWFHHGGDTRNFSAAELKEYPCCPNIFLVLEEQMEVLKRADVPTRLAALNWIKMINNAKPSLVDLHFDMVFTGIVETLSDPSLDVVSCAISVVSAICVSGKSKKGKFDKFIRSLISVLEDNEQALLSRAGYIFKLLSVEVGGELTYSTTARLLADFSNKQFVTLLVTTMHTLLLTAHELQPLREQLKKDGPRGTVFVTLYTCWCYNVVAAIALCFLARGYSLAYRLVTFCGDMELSVHTLFQLDRLIQLIESPALLNNNPLSSINNA